MRAAARTMAYLPIFLLLLPSYARGLTIDTTSGWDFSSGTCCFGEGSTTTYGQAFNVPATEPVLKSFTFWLDDRETINAPIDFEAYVMAWHVGVGLNPSHAVGPVLYRSAPVRTTNNGGIGGMEEFTFDVGGLTLMPDIPYVAFLDSSLTKDGINSSGYVGSVTPGAGSFVLLNTHGNTSLFTTGGWNRLTNRDLAFRAEFAPVATVPAPSLLLLLSTGLAGLAAWGYREGTG